MSTRMYVKGRELEVLLSRPFGALRAELGDREVSYSSDPGIPDYCSLEYRERVGDIRSAIARIVENGADFYSGGKPAGSYYADLLRYMEGMGDDEWLEYEAI